MDLTTIIEDDTLTLVFEMVWAYCEKHKIAMSKTRLSKYVREFTQSPQFYKVLMQLKEISTVWNATMIFIKSFFEFYNLSQTPSWWTRILKGSLFVGSFLVFVPGLQIVGGICAIASSGWSIYDRTTNFYNDKSLTGAWEWTKFLGGTLLDIGAACGGGMTILQSCKWFKTLEISKLVQTSETLIQGEQIAANMQKMEYLKKSCAAIKKGQEIYDKFDDGKYLGQQTARMIILLMHIAAIKEGRYKKVTAQTKKVREMLLSS